MDQDRKAILGRRARFVAAALAGAGLGAGPSCAADQKPAACLEPPQQVEVIVPEADAGAAEEPTDATLPARSPIPDAGPPKREPAPRICLSEW
ncbi:MAG: hypothetical protein HYZ29_05350 [Myxococcales bacterium]|nr:hypothetical protein [Myxococcales bacterium]